MLIDFELENFRSYKDRKALSMESGDRLRKWNHENTLVAPSGLRLLKCVAMFGANGSGKSSIIKGISLMRSIITNPTHDISEDLPFYPFRLDDSSAARPTVFKITFITNNFQYAYAITYNQNEILNENLSAADLRKKHFVMKHLFERDKDTKGLLPDGQENVAANTRKNSLLLYSLQANNYAPAIDVFNWFKQKLIIFSNQLDFSTFDDGFIDNPVVQTELNHFLRASDINIQGLDHEEMDVSLPQPLVDFLQSMSEKSDTSDDNRVNSKTKVRNLFTLHKKYDEKGNVIGTQRISLGNESTGTQRIVLIALAIIKSQLSDGSDTLIFDEFEEGLHYEMAMALVNLFNSPQNNNQFILATHQLKLLDAHLRVDQIYFTEKNYHGESDLYSLFDYGEAVSRPDIDFSKRYIKGQFGSVPIINLEDLKTALGAQPTMTKDKEKKHG